MSRIRFIETIMTCPMKLELTCFDWRNLSIIALWKNFIISFEKGYSQLRIENVENSCRMNILFASITFR